MDIEIEIIAQIDDPRSFRMFFDAGLSSKYFADDVCGRIYGFADRYFRTHGGLSDPPSSEVIAAEFPNYANLVNGATKGAATSYLIEELQKRYVAREMEKMLREYIPMIHDNPTDVARMVVSGMSAILQSSSNRSDSIEYGDDMDYQRKLEAEYMSLRSVPYCAKELTDRTGGGMKEGELTVFAAKPSGGKTWFACASALTAIKAGWDTYFATLEMPPILMAQRVELLEAGVVSPLSYSQGVRLPGDAQAIDEARTRILGYPGKLVIDQPPAGERDISSLVARCKANGCRFLIIDQLQFVQKDARFTESWRAIEQIIYTLKTEISAPADGIKLPVLLLHQFNREAVKGQGGGIIGSMSQLAGSSVIEQVADTVWGLGPGLGNERGRRSLGILKGRRFPEFCYQMVWETDARAKIEVDHDSNGRPVELEKWS